MIFKPRKHEVYTSSELSNEKYHGVKTYYSSSQLKEANEDIQTFHKIYITGEITKEFSTQARAAMDTGTYYHTAILEPEMLTKECAVWDGIRKGKAYEEFLVNNKGKTNITAKDFEKAKALISATKKDPQTLKLISAGEPELSAFTVLEGVNIRVRADWIDLQRGFILDLKSMSGNVRDQMNIKKKIDSMDYDLSAALYIDAFNAAFKKQKRDGIIKDFYWSFASKDQVSCQVYKATEEMIRVGRAKYRKALREIAEAEAKGWVFESKIIDVGPTPWQKDLWLEEEKNLEKKPAIKKVAKPEPKEEAESSDLL